jgi:plastocyanin
MNNKLLKFGLIVSGVFLLAGCSDQTGAPAGAPAKEHAPRQVIIDHFAYDPETLTVPAGTKVTWLNHDDVPHTATSSATPRAFDSGAVDTDETYSTVFASRGTFKYFCALHPHMTGTIVVQ